MFHFYRRTALKPWIVDAIMNHTNPEQRQNAAVLARIVDLNRREQIDLDVKDSQTGENAEKTGFEGSICDSQVFITALFSDEALKSCDDEENSSPSQQSSLAGTHVILKKYSIIINQVMREKRCEFMLYVEKFTLWGQGGHFNIDIMDCNQLPHVKDMMMQLHRDVSRAKALQEESQAGPSSDSVDNSTQSQVQLDLTELMELAGVEDSQKEEELDEDDIVEKDTTHLVIPSSEQCHLAHVIYDLTNLLIPEDQVNQLEELEDWKLDYVPPCSEKSSDSSYLDQAMSRDFPLQGTSPPDFYLKRDLSPGHSPHEPDSGSTGDLYLNNPLDNQPSLQLSTEEDDNEEHTQQAERVSHVDRSRNTRKRKLDSSDMGPPSRKTRTSSNAPYTLTQVVTKMPIFKGRTTKAPDVQKSSNLPSTTPTTQGPRKPHKPGSSSTNDVR
ncbi:uncharacterized protein [Branchiostoma lanceolatum]|uniref:uncharacterized protein n=1 Tax=Branchiostoma lanceolatum TaxID=7740 RepID=UPI00345639E5